jgi:hypothetical protein
VIGLADADDIGVNPIEEDAKAGAYRGPAITVQIVIEPDARCEIVVAAGYDPLADALIAASQRRVVSRLNVNF